MKRLLFWFAVSTVAITTGCVVLTPRTEIEYPREEMEMVTEAEAEAEGVVPDLRTTVLAAIEVAREYYWEGEFFRKEEMWSDARECYDQALRSLLRVEIDSDSLSDLSRIQSDLLSQISLAEVQVARIIYPDRKLPENSNPDFPVVLNPRVERWITHYLTNGREDFQKWLNRSTSYVPVIKEIFIQERVPLELAYVPLVESGFSPYAYSRARAVGLWQFISSTGKLAGLDRNEWMDERRDPVKSTVAAARHLKELYAELGDWLLALAAYNAGITRVESAVRSHGTRDYWSLILPAETENYVPKIMAAIIIAEDPEFYGFVIEESNNHVYDEVVIDQSCDLKVIARACDVSEKEVIDLNPELLGGCTPPDQQYVVRIPQGTKTTFEMNFAQMADSEKYLSKKEIERRANRYRWFTYRVRKGDTLGKIARRYRTTVSQLRKWNPKARGKYIYPGQKLRIYGRRT